MRARGYGRDRELTLRMFGTMFLLGLVYLVFMFFLMAYIGDIFIVLIFAGIILGIQYFTSAKVVLWSMGAKVVTPQEMPQLHGIVERLSQAMDIPKPKVAMATTDVPNAFATGRSPKHSVVCITSGLMQRLNDAELEAVLGHELAHIKNRDVMVMTLASFFATLAAILMRMFMWSAIFGGFGGRGGGRNNGAAPIMVIFMVTILVYFISQLLILALSRYREYAADRGGAILVGAPATLASALMKISGAIARIPQGDLRRVEGANAFFIIPAFSGKSLAHLLSSHPPVEKRVERLRRMQQEMERT